MGLALASLALVLAPSTLAVDENTVSFAEAADRALQQSMLTLSGSKPFHLQAVIRETTDPNSDYQAKIATLTKTAGCIPTPPILELPDCRRGRAASLKVKKGQLTTVLLRVRETDRLRCDSTRAKLARGEPGLGVRDRSVGRK